MLTCLLAIGSLPLPFPFPYFYTPITLPYPPFFIPTSCLHKRPPWPSPALFVFDRFPDKEPLLQLCTMRPVPPAVAPPAPPNTILEQQFRPRLLPATYSRLLEKHLQPMSQPISMRMLLNHTPPPLLRPNELSTENGRERRVILTAGIDFWSGHAFWL